MASCIVSEPRKFSYLIDVEHGVERADGGVEERGGELEDKRLKREGNVKNGERVVQIERI